jgi:replicative DNA helicase
MTLPGAAGVTLELAPFRPPMGLLELLFKLLTSFAQLSVRVALGLLKLTASRLVQVLLARSVHVILTALRRVVRIMHNSWESRSESAQCVSSWG